MQFHPRGLLVTVAFATLLWFTLEGAFGLATVAIALAIAFDAIIGTPLRSLIPQKYFSRFRLHQNASR